MSVVAPRFELALRRTLFFLGLLLVYLALGTVAFSYLRNPGGDKGSRFREARLDVKRSELLHVLWAETVSKGEAEWAENAHLKLEIYERALLGAYGIAPSDRHARSLSVAFRTAFALISTIGPLRSGEFSMWGKLFAFFYALLGIPIALLYLGQCGRMVTSVWQGPRALLPALGFLFFSALIYDIVEQGSDDTPFTDALFSVFLTFTTVGETDPAAKIAIMFGVSLVGLALFSVSFVVLQHEIEKRLQGFELSFSRTYGSLERYVTSEKPEDNDRIVEEDEEEEENDDY